MRPRYALALCVVALLSTPVVGGSVPGSAAVGGQAPAGATHGDHVSVDAQATSDGRVVVETVSAVGPSFVVLRRDDGGRPGEPVGHASVPASSFQTNVAVAIDESAWRDWSGPRRLWAVLHRDDGDGTFDSESDPSMARRNPAAAVSFVLGRTDAGADRVLARVFGSQRLQDGRLTVRRVDLSRSGFVVATSIDGSRVVGTRALDAGTHRNVTVELNESFLADQRRDFRVRLLAYHDDGDGRFDDGDRPVSVGEASVATSLVVEQPATDDGTPTTTRPLVITPTPGTTAGPDPATTPTVTPTPTGTGTAPARPTTASTSANGPGFGVVAVLLGVVLGVVAFVPSGGGVAWTGRRRR
ncbi:MAG: hypothetical protein V5A28_11050 [Haloarculaceae archaeon]